MDQGRKRCSIGGAPHPARTVAALLMASLVSACQPGVVGDEARPTPRAATATPEDTGPWTPAGDEVQADCERAADALGFPVPCPTVLPGDYELGILEGRGVVWGKGFHFVAPLPGDLPSPPSEEQVTHVLIGAGLNRFPDCDGTEYATQRMGQGDVTLYECPDTAGLHADHVLAQWEVDGVWYQASSHVIADPEFHERVVVGIVEGIQLVRPG